MGISLVPEGRGLFPGMSILENLEMGAFTDRGRRSKDETLEQVYPAIPDFEDEKETGGGHLSAAVSNRCWPSGGV